MINASSFGKVWNNFRGIFIVIAILLAILATIKASSHAVDFGLPTPTEMQMERNNHEREGREAFDKFERSEPMSEREQKQAVEWSRDHTV